MKTEKICDLCGRQVDGLTKHHLIPKTRHTNKGNKKKFSREEVRDRVAYFCRDCHVQIHAVLTEKELETEYNTLELLLTQPDIKVFVDWIKCKNFRNFRIRRANRRK